MIGALGIPVWIPKRMNRGTLGIATVEFPNMGLQRLLGSLTISKEGLAEAIGIPKDSLKSMIEAQRKLDP